jgi:hypothetical protein
MTTSDWIGVLQASAALVAVLAALWIADRDRKTADGLEQPTTEGIAVKMLSGGGSWSFSCALLVP